MHALLATDEKRQQQRARATLKNEVTAPLLSSRKSTCDCHASARQRLGGNSTCGGTGAHATRLRCESCAALWPVWQHALVALRGQPDAPRLDHVSMAKR
eukprot:2935097-Pleurochrysis_carterae.AAC.2